MRIFRIPQDTLSSLIEQGIACAERSYYLPSFDDYLGLQVQPYCDLTELHWERTRSGQVYFDNLYILPLFSEAGKQLQLIRQTPKLCQAVYKTHMERTGIAVRPDLSLEVITPPVLGIKGNEPVFLDWKRQGSVEDMRVLCEQARQAFRSSLFALSVRALELDYSSIPALRY